MFILGLYVLLEKLVLGLITYWVFSWIRHSEVPEIRLVKDISFSLVTVSNIFLLCFSKSLFFVQTFTELFSPVSLSPS